ncbi:MAG: bifunctional YncE family protein/alkaline phosphatase family protein [Cyclobacteriaceae bacterium]
MKGKYVFIFTLILLSACQPEKKRAEILQVPGINEYSIINTSGNSVVPSGRYITPAGKTIRIDRAPYGLCISPDGKKIVVLHHNGTVTISETSNFDVAVRIPSYDKKIVPVMEGASFLGVAFSADSKHAYLSAGDLGKVIVLDVNTYKRVGEIKLNGAFDGVDYQESFTSDLIIDYESNHLFALDRANNRLVRIDLKTKKIIASIKVGRIPFGIALSPDKKYALVANAGLFEYPAVPGVTKENRDTMMLDKPPYGTFSKEMEEGVEVEGRKIPGLGSPLVPEAMSVWIIDLATNKVIDQHKTGHQIGQLIEGAEIVGGASPNSIVVGSNYAYVSNATNDNISVIDLQNHSIKEEIPILVDARIDKYRGLTPFGMALSKDERTLYVALLGFNAVAVIDTETKKAKGLIPTGWGATRVKISPEDKKLYIISARGYGAGPNGGAGFVEPPQGTYIGDIQLGTLQQVDVPTDEQLSTYTKQVIDNTFREVEMEDDGKNPLPPLPKLRESPIKYIVYINKENRSYDEVFGQFKNGKGDSTLSRFGVNVTYTLPDSMKEKFQGLKVMPNHHKMAKQFAFSDNFYCDSDASIHGHHWLAGVMPNEYVEANSAADAKFNTFSSAPGRRFPKSTGAIDPEDYNEIGGMWEALERSNVPFYSFGEGNEYAGVWEEWNHTSFGARQPVVFPMQNALYKNTSWNYAGFNMKIPDQYRMDQFEKEFTEKWIKGKEEMPRLLAMQVPNDHGSDPRPEAGFSYIHSYMADNDLAIGRILHFLSRTKYWKNMLVIMMEDDPQGGVDHIDAHRSVLMMAGPYVKRGYVSHTHANFGSLIKTVYNILNVPYVNQYDATASLLQDFFTDKPNFTPYTLEPCDIRIFDPQKAMDVYHKTFDMKKILDGPIMDDEEEQRASFYKQHPANTVIAKK